MPLHDRYPNADVLAQRGHWDDATRQVVLDRVHNVPTYTYFDTQQRATLEALCARIVPQGHRPADRRIPIGPWIDQRCASHTTEGFRFDDMPANGLAWTWGLEGLDQTARSRFGESTTFRSLDDVQQDEILEVIREGDPPGEVWCRLPAKRWWVFVVLRQITGIYYAHPYAWDEIGFGGPAYPRGYLALNFGAREPWEAGEAPPQAPRPLADGRDPRS
jgi:hypothetical protein